MWFQLASAGPAGTKEEQIRAAFLYNFTKFVEWPAQKFVDTNAPIVIGVVGHTSFGDAVAEAVKGRKVNGREVHFKRIETVSEVDGLHVLFISEGDLGKFPGLGQALTSGSVLGVGESEAFLQIGGCIRFLLEGDKVRFEINIESAKHAKLKINSELLKLARPMKPKN